MGSFGLLLLSGLARHISSRMYTRFFLQKFRQKTGSFLGKKSSKSTVSGQYRTKRTFQHTTIVSCCYSNLPSTKY